MRLHSSSLSYDAGGGSRRCWDINDQLSELLDDDPYFNAFVGDPITTYGEMHGENV